MTNKFILSRKYATAFLEVYGATMTLDDYHHLQAFKRAWDSNNQWRMLVTSPANALEKKIMLLEQMLVAYHIMPDFMRLIKLLIIDKREILISLVTAMVCTFYLK